MVAGPLYGEEVPVGVVPTSGADDCDTVTVTGGGTGIVTVIVMVGAGEGVAVTVDGAGAGSAGAVIVAPGSLSGQARVRQPPAAPQA